MFLPTEIVRLIIEYKELFETTLRYNTVMAEYQSCFCPEVVELLTEMWYS